MNGAQGTRNWRIAKAGVVEGWAGLRLPCRPRLRRASRQACLPATSSWCAYQPKALTPPPLPPPPPAARAACPKGLPGPPRAQMPHPARTVGTGAAGAALKQRNITICFPWMTGLAAADVGKVWGWGRLGWLRARTGADEGEGARVREARRCRGALQDVHHPPLQLGAASGSRFYCFQIRPGWWSRGGGCLARTIGQVGPLLERGPLAACNRREQGEQAPCSCTPSPRLPLHTSVGSCLLSLKQLTSTPAARGARLPPPPPSPFRAQSRSSICSLVLRGAAQPPACFARAAAMAFRPGFVDDGYDPYLVPDIVKQFVHYFYRHIRCAATAAHTAPGSGSGWSCCLGWQRTAGPRSV